MQAATQSRCKSVVKVGSIIMSFFFLNYHHYLAIFHNQYRPDVVPRDITHNAEPRKQSRESD